LITADLPVEALKASDQIRAPAALSFQAKQKLSGAVTFTDLAENHNQRCFAVLNMTDNKP